MAELLFLLCLTAAAHAQYRFDVWTADDGLPQNIIRGVRQSEDGYLWVATLDGLARFDGVHSTIYNRNNTPGITSNRFVSLYADHHGDLWMDTERGGLTHYQSGVFETLGQAEGILGSRVDGLTGDDDGNVWILSDDKVEQWKEKQHRFEDITPPGDAGRYLPLLWQTGFWRVDQAGLHCFFRGEFLSYALPQWLNASSIWVVARDGHGTMWLETHDGRRAVIRSGSSTVETLDPTATPTTSFVDRSGHQWIMKVGKRLERSIEYASSGRTQSITFRRLYQDREDNLWLCTEGHGLYRLQRESIQSISTAQGLPSPNVYPLLADHRGVIWIGTWGGGLSSYDHGRVKVFDTPGAPRIDPVTALAEDHLGRIWVARDATLNIVDHDRLSTPASFDLPGNASVQAIYDDSAGTMWFGTSKGLVAYRDGKAQRFTTQDGIATDDVRVIIGDGDGGIWFGGYGGLTHWKHGKFTPWAERDGLPGDSIRSLYRDSDGVLWIGTYDGGLGRMESGRMTRFTTASGLFNNGVFQILEDNQGNFWMSCNRGIYRVSKRELNEFAHGARSSITSVAYGKADGMPNVECNGGFWPAGTRSPDGRLWFPTQDGVAVIDTRFIASNPQAPPVVIESAAIDLSPVSVSEPIRMVPSKQNLEIQYTALSFINSEQIRFRYMLEGLDTDWVNAGSRRSVYYSHLPVGKYVFHVVAENRDGVWNQQGQRLAVTVLAPFYKTRWFIGLLVLAGSLTLWGAWNLRSAQFARVQGLQRVFAQQLIASQESERKRIAAELHDSLGQRLVVINNLAILSMRGHAGNPSGPDDTHVLQEISAEAMSAMNETRSIAYDLRPFQLDRLGLTKAIEGMVRSVSRASNLRFITHLDNIDELFAEELRINVYRIIQESLNNVMKYADATVVHVEIHKTPELMILTVEDNGKGIRLDHHGEKDPLSGFGMTGMLERANLLGGELSIASAPTEGTTLTVTVHLMAANSA